MITKLTKHPNGKVEVEGEIGLEELDRLANLLRSTPGVEVEEPPREGAKYRKIKKSTRNPNANSSWDLDSKIAAHGMRKRGKSNREISLTLGRTEKAISAFFAREDKKGVTLENLISLQQALQRE